MAMIRPYVAGGLGAVAVLAGTLFVTPHARPTVSAAAQSSTMTHTGPVWGHRTLAALAEMMAQSAHDATPSSAVYFTTTRDQGNLATSGDYVDGGSMPVDVVVMHGHFSNPTWASEPPGAPPLRGNTLVLIVDAQNGRGVDGGLVTQTSAQASALIGRLTALSASHPLTVTPACLP